jgi:hypothetical protein
MQRRWNAAVFSILIFSSTSNAFEKDTTQTYHANEVVVTATRSAILQDDSPSPINILTFQEIQRTNGSSFFRRFFFERLRSNGCVENCFISRDGCREYSCPL